MSADKQPSWNLSRRDVLRQAGAGTIAVGVGLATLPGSALALNKAELVEAMASEAGLSKADAKRALDAVTAATTRALTKGDRVALVGFGSFSVSKRPQTKRRGLSEHTAVGFDPCPEFAAALDLIPGAGDERRTQSCSNGRDADLVIDAEVIASETERGSDRGLAAATAQTALDGFINATTNALNGDDTVSLDGFGSFSISKRSARTGRNPQTGKEIQIAAKNVVTFKAGAELSKAVN